MSLKDTYKLASSIKNISDMSEGQLADEVESVGYHEQDVIEESRFIPRIDFSSPDNFAFYGSAEEYYKESIKRVYSTYPYDGSLKERLEWENNSTYIDLYLLNNQYPRTNGFIITSADGWGAASGAITSDGYGTPVDQEYISFIGGPNQNPDGMKNPLVQFTGSNYWDPAKNRASNLEFNLAEKGASIEFWLKKDQFIPASTPKEVVFDLWNNKLSSSAHYGRLRIELSGASDGLNPFRLTVLSGAAGFQDVAIGSSNITTASVADNAWHHYAVTLMSTSAGVNSRFYIDGDLNSEQVLGSVGLNTITGTLRAHIGALIASPSASSALIGAGKLSASLDEFRYWKTRRSSKDIGRYWISQVGGGTNTDPEPTSETTNLVNTDLGVYYKFNEGITGVQTTDSTVLDYSGRISNGEWTGYTSNSRNTGSAIVISKAAIKEFKDPIIYSFHPAVIALEAELQNSGSYHDVRNNSSMYNSIPAWIIEEDEEGGRELKKLTQIMGSYFDTLQLQIQSLSTLKDITYVSGTQKPLPFASRLLESAGFVAPELFVDADVLEKLADRSEKHIYEKSLSDIKNTIYQNIYNNLNYIYKSKGTEKAFRNLIRCFGIDDELVKFNLYANNIEYELRTNSRATATAKKFVDFNTIENTRATVYQYLNPDNSNSVSFTTGSTNLTEGFAFTTEVDLIFPLKATADKSNYISNTFISASIFGVHKAGPVAADTTWFGSDETNFQVFAVRDEEESSNVRFVLTSSTGGYIPRLESDLYEDVYDNTRWNLAVRVRPEKYPYENLAVVTPTPNYIVELHGTNVQDGVVLNTFTVSGTIATPPSEFIAGSRRLFVGAHRQNFTGSILRRSDVKVGNARHWLTYLNDAVLLQHTHDIFNYGTYNPHWYAFPFQPSASFGEIPQLDTLALNWDFNENTGSNVNGRFAVSDFSSGSAELAASQFSWLGPILSNQHTGRGDFFGSNSTTAIDKDYITNTRQNLPENLQSIDMISVLTSEKQEEFTPITRPVTFYFAFEKSLYQVISEQMINYFATMRDMHTLIGAPVNRYRMDYKALSKVRQAYFLNVQNSIIDFDKFYEFYKWFDSSLSAMLRQLVPASADVAQNIRTMIESHILERNKYQSKFPTLNRKDPIIEGVVCNVLNSAAGGWKFNHHPLSGLQNTNQSWWKNRAARNKPPLATGDAGVDYSREKLFDGSQRDSGPCLDSTQYKFSVSRSIPGEYPNKKWDFVFPATYPAGPLVKGMNIPTNIMLAFEREVEKLQDVTDIIKPNQKRRLGWGIDAVINKSKSGSADYQNAKGHLLAPFNLYSSSVTTGYNKLVKERFMKGVMITDLHNDIYGEVQARPLQGPFTEQYVGGREYRHVPLNKFDSSKRGLNNLDYVEDRPEGFKLLLGMCTDRALKSVSYSSFTASAGIGSKKIQISCAPTCTNAAFTTGWRMSSSAFPVTGASLTVSTWVSASEDTLTWDNHMGIWAHGADGIGEGLKQLSFDPTPATPGQQDFLQFLVQYDSTDALWISDQSLTSSKYLTEGPGWYHLAVSYTSGSQPPHVFINGVSASYSSWQAPAGNMETCYPSATVGNRPQPNYSNNGYTKSSFYSGSFRDHATWNRQLSDAECLQLFGTGSTNTTTCGTVLPLLTTEKKETTIHHPGPIDITASTGLTAGLMSWYRFGNTSGDSLTEIKNALGTDPLHFVCGAGLGDIPAKCPEYILDLSAADIAIAGGGESLSCEITSSVYTNETSGALGIVDPQYPDPDSPAVSPPYLFDRPKGNLLRNVGAKRPVNIRNIEMTTGSTILGNYRMNYDVIQSNARSSNDLFFREQTFDFSLYPQLPFPRLLDIRAPNKKAASIDDSGNCYIFAADSAMNTNKAETWSFWMKCTNIAQDNYFVVGAVADDRYLVLLAGGSLRFNAYFTSINGQWTTDDPVVSGDEWTHVAISYNGSSITNVPEMYINGKNVPITAAPSPTGDLEPYDGNIYIGYPSAVGFEGDISDIAFYNTNLTANEIADIYGNATLNLINHGPLRVSSNLTLWWRMGDGSGDTAALINDQMGNQDLTAAGAPTLIDIAAVDCFRATAPRGPLDSRIRHSFALPNRSGKNSNQTVFVNRFAGSGYEVMSRGYMDPAHEEKSVYSALPYHNLSILNYGLSGSASVDPSTANSIVVVDQIGKNRGRNQRLTLHCGQFGHDAAYGTIPTDTYVTVPSYQKINRNTKYRIETGSYFTASVYDNGWVTHQIPQSDRQYAWITASLAPGTTMLGYMGLSGGFPQSWPAISASEVYSMFQVLSTNRFWGWPKELLACAIAPFCNPGSQIPTDFAGMNTIVVEAISSSFNTLGYPKMTLDPYSAYYKSNYINSAVIAGGTGAGKGYGILASAWEVPGEGAILNSIILNRGGPYGWPTWKQIRTREHPVVRYQREYNILSQRSEPDTFVYPLSITPGPGPIPLVPTVTVTGLKGNTFTQYVEQPISSRHNALEFAFEGGQWNSIPGVPDAYNQSWYADPLNPEPPDDSVIAKVSWGNNIDYFSHQALDNRLDLIPNVTFNEAYETLVNFTLDAGLNNSADSVVEYTERIYPREVNAYRTRTRTRTEYSIADVWERKRSDRSTAPTTPAWLDSYTGPARPYTTNTFGSLIYSSSIWALDGHVNFATVPAIPSATGTVLLMGGVFPNDSAGQLQNDYCRFNPFQNALSGTSGGTCGLTFLVGCNKPNRIRTAALYNMRVFMGSSSTTGAPIWGGDALWEAPIQAGKQPYRPYEEYAEFIRLKGKDHTIIPEFKISDHIENFVEEHGSDWMTDLDETTGMFNISGAAVSSSAQSTFYRIYGHTDFLKYFKVIDDDLNNKNINEGKRLERQELQLECSAYLKFLPYKGFYPAERALALTSIFNKSYGNHMAIQHSASSGSACADLMAAVTSGDGWVQNSLPGQLESSPTKFLNGPLRPIIEPLFAPGILFNTIKSGIAVSNFMVYNTGNITAADIDGGLGRPDVDISEATDLYAGTVDSRGFVKMLSNATSLREGTIDFGAGSWGALGGNYGAPGWANESPTASSSYNSELQLNLQGGYGLKVIPFEALLKPASYLAGNTISGGLLYDTGLAPSASMKQAFSPYTSPLGGACTTASMWNVLWKGGGSSLYELAIDNFVCETVNFFLGPEGLTNFVSKREDEFLPVVSGAYYAMKMRLRRTGEVFNVQEGTTVADTGSFEMYNRGSAFGPPFAGKFKYAVGPPQLIYSASFDPVTPPYFNGEGNVTILYKAKYDGKPTLDDIISTSEFIYDRTNDHETSNPVDRYSPGRLWGMQVNQSFNLADKLIDVPPNTDSNRERWLIQSKFETPILNFTGATVTAPAPGSMRTGLPPSPPGTLPSGSWWLFGDPGLTPSIISRGMWHQYGEIPHNTDTGVTVQLSTPSPVVSKNQELSIDSPGSLAKIVGFNTDEAKKIGTIRNKQWLSEAIILVPFTLSEHGPFRQFFELTEDMDAYPRVVNILDRYILPPKFDFITNAVVGGVGPHLAPVGGPLPQGTFGPVLTPSGPTIAPALAPVGPGLATPTPNPGGPFGVGGDSGLAAGSMASVADMFGNTVAGEKILFYAFEFGTMITQQDLADIWQNLPPDIGTQFKKADPLYIRETELIKEMYNSVNSLRWMVFKVKRKAEKSYNVFTKKGLTTDISTIPPNIDSKYSYNWPYDYFSLVELAKIDATAKYSPQVANQIALDTGPLLFPPSLGGGNQPLNILGQPYGPPQLAPPTIPQIPGSISLPIQAGSSGLKKRASKLLQMMTKGKN